MNVVPGGQIPPVSNVDGSKLKVAADSNGF
jgi:hypothetical protein